MSEKKRLLKNTSLIAIGNIGAKAISFLLLPLYTSLLTTSEYGTYDFIISLSAFLLPIVTLSMHESMFRFIIDTDESKEDFKKIVTNSLFSVCLGILIFGLILLLINSKFPNTNNLYLFLYVSANSIYTFSNNLLRGLGKIKVYSITSSAKNILQLILNVLCVAVFRFGIVGLLLSLCISEIIAIVVIFTISKIRKIINLKYFSLKYFKELLRYSLPLIPNNLSAQIINISDRVVIKYFLGVAQNGIYSVAYKFPSVIETVYYFFYMAWSESASRSMKENKEVVKEYYQSLYLNINNFIFGTIILIISFMPFLFKILINVKYIDGYNYIPILLFAMYFNCLSKYYSGIYTAYKKTKMLAISTMIAAGVNLLINIILINKIGLYAAAFSTLIAEILLLLIRKRFISNDIKIVISKKIVFIEIIISCILMVLYDYNNLLKSLLSIVISSIYMLVMNKEIFKTLYLKLFKRNKVKK